MTTHQIQYLPANSFVNKKQNLCQNILKTLPDWFGLPEALLDYVKDSGAQDMFVTVDQTGFLTLKPQTHAAVELAVMGVLPEHHGKGIGKVLLSAAVAHLRQRNITYLTVKTLSEQANSKPYDATRAFYLKQGFVPLEVFPTLWDAHNPCLLMVLAL